VGEYAIYRGERIKIGTCEDMYYLRAEQRDRVTGWDGDWLTVRFRFPWPDEDHVEPGGAFEDHERGLTLPGLVPPVELAAEHYRVQFLASVGYNVCLPCPESGERVTDGTGGALTVHRNGFAGAVSLVQQRFWEGSLVGVLRCRGCGLAWRLETASDLTPVLEVVRAEAQLREQRSAGTGDWYAQVADRLLAGYDQRR
jgi:hypothetical protein